MLLYNKMDHKFEQKQKKAGFFPSVSISKLVEMAS